MNTSFSRRRSSWFLFAAVVLFISGCAAHNPPAPDKGKVIHLLAATSTSPARIEKEKEKLSKSHDKHNHVRWFNETGETQKIIFNSSDWIFMEPHQAVIEVAAGARTEWFTVKEDADEVEHTYSVQPLLSGFPGEPSVTAEP
jgi:hypothetical protein